MFSTINEARKWFIDKKTSETVNKIDLEEYLPKNGYIEQVTYADGKFKVRVTSFDSKTSQMAVKDMVIDAKNGKVLETKDKPYDENVDRYYETLSSSVFTQLRLPWNGMKTTGHSTISIFPRAKIQMSRSFRSRTRKRISTVYLLF